MNDLLRALSLLTILPVRPRWDESVPLGRAMTFYPLVGLGIGGLLAAEAALLNLLNDIAGFTSLRATLLLVTWVAITGGLHLDGWGDACDALLSAVDRERRLEILRDPRMGSFGVIGIVSLLLMKLAGLQAIHDRAPLVLAPTLSRWFVVLAAAGWPSARPGGMGDRFRQGLHRWHVAWATLTALAAVVWFQLDGVIALMAALITGWMIARFAAGRLGGLTGDIYGAIIEGVEVIILVTLTLT
ncbi:MAG: adenosylcobinamide-GDP ribazoletransferase [Anaerolineae bacterium]|nr:adenosylcobinamide-GDP ribazoletransferase [Anaerolineae bacterium]MDW8099661.1 adenosylcobinamide-GDP ribazoletransferase [Anaerolineae bacterium]